MDIETLRLTLDIFQHGLSTAALIWAYFAFSDRKYDKAIALTLFSLHFLLLAKL